MCQVSASSVSIWASSKIFIYRDFCMCFLLKMYWKFYNLVLFLKKFICKCHIRSKSSCVVQKVLAQGGDLYTGCAFPRLASFPIWAQILAKIQGLYFLSLILKVSGLIWGMTPTGGIKRGQHPVYSTTRFRHRSKRKMCRNAPFCCSWVKKLAFPFVVFINFEFGYGHGGFGSSGARAFGGSLVG